MPETPDTEDPPAAADERLSIDELAVLTGLTARTVRYYRAWSTGPRAPSATPTTAGATSSSCCSSGGGPGPG